MKYYTVIWVFPKKSKNRGKTPKMVGLFHGKPYEQMDDLGVKTIPIFGWKHPNMGIISYLNPWEISGSQ